MLALTTATFWVMTIANIAGYTSLMAAIYPDRERGQAIGKVRIGFSMASVASAAVAGAFIDALPAGRAHVASGPGSRATTGRRSVATA